MARAEPRSGVERGKKGRRGREKRKREKRKSKKEKRKGKREKEVEKMRRKKMEKREKGGGVASARWRRSRPWSATRGIGHACAVVRDARDEGE